MLEAIDGGINFCGNPRNALDDVWRYLNTSTLSFQDAAADAVAKRVLLIYRLRNETSHNLDPSNPAIVPHYDDFWLWSIEALMTFFWTTTTGAVNL